MKAIGFDLGDTLVEYEGLPLSWVEYYPEALANLSAYLGIAPDPGQIDDACAVLRRYNTRLNPRVAEVSFATILQKFPPGFRSAVSAVDDGCARAFFRVFRQRLRCFPDSKAALASLRDRAIPIGVFTDVPYGMPRELVLEDLRETGLERAFNVFLTSGDAGYRKPSPATLALLAEKLECAAVDMTYVGNEQKDMQAARAFGCHAILIDRNGHHPDFGQDHTIGSLADLPL